MNVNHGQQLHTGPAASIPILMRRIEELEAIVGRLPRTTEGGPVCLSRPVCIGDTVWINPDDNDWIEPWEDQPHFEEGCGPQPFVVTSYVRLRPPAHRDPVDRIVETEWQLIQPDGDDVEPEEYYWWEGAVYATEEAARAAKEGKKP